MKFACLLALLLPCCAFAQEKLPDPQALSPADWYGQILDRSERGEDAAVHRLFNRDAPPPPEGVAPYRYYTNLARAALGCEWHAGVHRFIRLAGPPPAGEPDLRWLSGLAYLFTGDYAKVWPIIEFYEGLERNHPGACYLKATQQYLEWRRIGPADPKAAELYAEAVRNVEIATDGALILRKNSPYDRRFTRLRVSLAEFAPDARAYTAASGLRSSSQVRNAAFFRDYLASTRGEFDFASMEFQLLALRLPPDELEAWKRFAAAGADASDPAAEMRDRLAALPATADFARARLTFLRTEFKRHNIISRIEAWHAEHPPGDAPAIRAAAYADRAAEFGPDYPALLAAYARLAADTRNPADCYYALRLMDAHLTRPDADRAAFAPLEITLAAVAGDRPRAIALVKAQADAHATDLPWWRQHASLMENHADLVAAFIYFRQLAVLQPDNLDAQFALLGIADRDVHFEQALIDARHRVQIHEKYQTLPDEQREKHPLALLASPDRRETAYAELFQQVPARGVPATRHWENYEKLLQSRQETLQFLDGAKAAPSGTVYRQLVERCYREKPKDPTILREARKVRTAEALRLARATLELQPGPAGEAAKASYEAALAAANEVGVSDAALAPAREAFEVYALREKGAAASAKARTEFQNAGRAAPATPAGISPFARKIIDAFNARVRRIEGLKPTHDEAAAASWNRNDFRTQQAKEAIERKENIKRHLCQSCQGRGLLVVINSTLATLRPCRMCNSTGMNDQWTDPKAAASYPDFTQIEVPRGEINL